MIPALTFLPVNVVKKVIYNFFCVYIYVINEFLKKCVGMSLYYPILLNH